MGFGRRADHEAPAEGFASVCAALAAQSGAGSSKSLAQSLSSRDRRDSSSALVHALLTPTAKFPGDSNIDAGSQPSPRCAMTNCKSSRSVESKPNRSSNAARTSISFSIAGLERCDESLMINVISVITLAVPS